MAQQNIAPVEEASTSIAVQLEEMKEKWQMSLPEQIPIAKFERSVIIALQQNPNLIHADRKTLWRSCSQAAQDGLLPDGKEAALVVFKTKMKFTTPQGGSVEKFVDAVQYIPMIAGLRKKVRNSGEITEWNARVVYARDKFLYKLGDEEMILHEPYIGPEDRGEVVAAYSIAHLKSGEVSREVMSRRDIYKIRGASKAPDSPAWKNWFDEMARKSVAKRHAKVLPMNTDLDDLVRRVTAEVEARDDLIAPPPKRPQLSDFTSAPGGSKPQPVEQTPPADQQGDKPAEDAQNGAQGGHDPETGEVTGEGDKPASGQEQPAEGQAEESHEFNADDAFEMGAAHRVANKPMSPPLALDKQWHEAFKNGWRKRDDAIAAEKKKAGK